MPTIRQQNRSIYYMWKSLKQRCNNPKCSAYKNYGARGITYCKEWEKFEPFYYWAISNGYKKGLDLDRKNNDDNYNPENCRFITRCENINNRRNTLYITVNNEKKPLMYWARLVGIERGLLKGWLYKNGEKYCAKRIIEILANGYIPKNYSYGHLKKVKHIESGKVFNSVKETAEYFGYASCTISNAIREKRTIKKGTFIWEELA